MRANYPAVIRLDNKPFTLHQSILDWYNISSNERMTWTLQIIKEFADRLDFGNDSEDDPDADLPWFNCNEKLPWSIELLETFKDKWCWELLAQNQSLMQRADLVLHFHDELEPYLEEEEMIKRLQWREEPTGKCFRTFTTSGDKEREVKQLVDAYCRKLLIPCLRSKMKRIMATGCR